MMRKDYEFIGEDKNDAIICSICCITVLILITSSLNVAGLVIGVTNQNATCYQDKYIMSLSKWLIIENSVAVTVSFLYLIFLILVYMGYNQVIFGLIIAIFSSAAFYFIMMILGIIELAYQFPSCKSEVSSVCGMVILSIILSLIYTLSTSYGQS